MLFRVRSLKGSRGRSCAQDNVAHVHTHALLPRDSIPYLKQSGVAWVSHFLDVASGYIEWEAVSLCMVTMDQQDTLIH